MSLVIFTAMVGFVVAPGRRDALTSCIALFCIAAGAGGAGALNMWYEAELDAARTTVETARAQWLETRSELAEVESQADYLNRQALRQQTLRGWLGSTPLHVLP